MPIIELTPPTRQQKIIELTPPTKTVESMPDQPADETDADKFKRIIGGFTPVQTVDALLTLGSGFAGEVAAGLSGIAATALPGEPGAGARQVEKTREFFSRKPQTQGAQDTLETVGEFIEPIVDAAGKVSDETAKVGGVIGTAFDVPVLGETIGKIFPTALAEIVGAKGLGGITRTPKVRVPKELEIRRTNKAVDDMEEILNSTDIDEATKIERLKDVANKAPDSPVTNQINDVIEGGDNVIVQSQETITGARTIAAETKAEEFIAKGSRRVQANPLARATVKQGFDEGVVDAVLGASRSDKNKMNRMLDILKRGKGDKRFAAVNRPGDVIGDSILARFKVVKNANTQAGKQLDETAKRLKGQQVNTNDAIGTFLDDLDDMGVNIDVDGKLDYTGSIIEDLKGPQDAINRVYKRTIQANKSGDAFDAHRLKKLIDENVDFGRGSAEGLSGKSEGIIKSLRRNIDQSLDNKFADYKAVNDQFSQTKGILDEFQSVAGKSIDLTSPNANKSIGVLSRRLLSNVQSRSRLIDALDELQTVATRQGGKFDDDIITQVMFADELESVFGPSARTSLQGEVGKAVEKGIREKSVTGIALDAAISTANKARGINDINAIKSMKALLK